MKMIFSTADVHPRDAFSYWHEVLTKKIIRHNCVPESRRSVKAELQAGALSDVDLLILTSSQMRYEVTRQHVEQGKSACFFVFQSLEGNVSVEQDGREAVLEPGDIALADSRRPIAATYSEASKTLLLKVPVEQLEMRVGKIQQLTAYPMRPVDGEVRLTSQLLSGVANDFEKLMASSHDMIRDLALDLVGVSLTKAIGSGVPRLSSARTLIMTRIRAAIESRLSDQSLDATSVAAAAGVSIRYANEVLAVHDTSIRRLIVTRRLERCRRILADPLQSDRTISDIAYSWGFSDMTHFGRKFREAYGSLPSDFRKRNQT